MEHVNQALSDATKRQPANSSPNNARALVAGAVGRRGEALLNAVLARGGYEQVNILAGQPISIGIERLAVFTLDDVPAARDLFLVLTDGGDDMERSFHGRDAAFVQVDEHNALAIAEKAAAAGVERITLIAPAPVLLQFGSLQNGLSSTLERGLNSLSPKRFVVLRPLRQTRAAGVTLVQKIVSAYMSIQMLMMPRAIEPVTSDQLARAALNALNAEENGVSIVPAGQLSAYSRRERTAQS